MPSHASPPAASSILLKASLLLLAVSLSAIEFFIPRIPLFPWLKPGLANVITIVWVVRFGLIDTLLLGVLRIWIVGFYFGFSLLTMSLSLSGTLCATVAMSLSWRLFGNRRLLGLVGLGMIGAAFHNFGQLLAVYALLARNTHLLYQAPFMAGASLLFGGLVGLLAAQFIRAGRTLHSARATLPVMSTPAAPARTNAGLAALILLWSCTVMFFDALEVLTASALAATLFTQLIYRGSLRALVRPLASFWLLFVTVVLLHTFFSYGRAIPMVPGATYEGLHIAGVQSLRLWTWLQLSALLRWAGFATILFRILTRLFPTHGDTLAAGMLALQYFPETIAQARAGVAFTFRTLRRSPRNAMTILVLRTFDQIAARLANAAHQPADIST